MGASYKHARQGRAISEAGSSVAPDARGFTVVEVMLFLAISALLAMVLLGGWTVMINTQRYKDSNKTLQSFLQQQYNLVYNVENGRADDISCIDTGGAYTITSTPSERGQSQCVVMGRYISIQDGVNLKVSSIVGLDHATDDSNSDIESIKLYKPQRVDFPVGLTDNELEIPWQAAVVGTGGDTTPKNYAIAIVRTPLTGIVHTYTLPSGGDAPSVEEMIDIDNENKDVNLCLDPGGVLAGGRMGIVVKAYASAQSSVQSIPDGGTACS